MGGAGLQGSTGQGMRPAHGSQGRHQADRRHCRGAPGGDDPPGYRRSAGMADRQPALPGDRCPAHLNALVHLPSFVAGKAGAIVKPTPGFLLPLRPGLWVRCRARRTRELARFPGLGVANDGESIQTLQEWMGYLLTLDKSQHKMAMLIGPPRSGRGTICRRHQETDRGQQRRQPHALRTGVPVRGGMPDRQARGHHRRCQAIQPIGLGGGSGTDPDDHGRRRDDDRPEEQARLDRRA